MTGENPRRFTAQPDEQTYRDNDRTCDRCGTALVDAADELVCPTCETGD